MATGPRIDTTDTSKPNRDSGMTAYHRQEGLSASSEQMCVMPRNERILLLQLWLRWCATPTASLEAGVPQLEL
jgi:hypothetical protein